MYNLRFRINKLCYLFFLLTIQIVVNSKVFTKSFNYYDYPSYLIENEIYAYFPYEPEYQKNEYLREKGIQHYYVKDNSNGIQYDVMVFTLPIIINDFDVFADNVIKGELISSNGELLYQGKNNHNGKNAIIYGFTYNANNGTAVKNVILFVNKNKAYKWSVQGYQGISDDEALLIFNLNKALFRLK